MKAKIGLLLIAILLMAAAPPKVELCHFGRTMEVPAGAVEAHLAHGDYLGACVPEPVQYVIYLPLVQR